MKQPDASSNDLTRRDFVTRVLAVGGAGAFLPALISACGGEERPATPDSDVLTPEGEEGQVMAEACPGFDELTDQDMQLRQALEYVDVSPNATQVCSNCQFYTEPEAGSQCGGCELFQGPVAPGGYCNSWAAQQA